MFLVSLVVGPLLVGAAWLCRLVRVGGVLGHVTLLFLGTMLILLDVVVSLSDFAEVTTAAAVTNGVIAVVAVVVCALSVRTFTAR
ncbi:hypothetical protein [Corynebacterium kalidii]|uniref:Uncharacterized protein n=1 Tax=Corynebacterium kalidii TaxID=2931982 RepID=A0A9X1WIT8_9CORY|nr:hypothetical protein [Corynebacterium kalidii]MCJ7858190.1 hypothetical protein [Corynebacterium kalidii]